MDKAQVAAILDDVANLLELSGGNPFEPRAYQNAARAIGGMDGDIEEAVQSGRISTLPGMGKTLVARVTELVTTGHLALYEKLLAEVPAGLREMLRIPGLGPKRIRQIHEALGIETLADLRAACENGQVAQLPGFGVKSQEKILKGLIFVSEHANKYRYDVAAHDAEAIAAALRALPQVVRLDVAGSIRRRKEIVKDMDIVGSVARDEDRAVVMATLVRLPQVESVTGQGDTKTSVVLRSGIACDFRLVRDEEYPYLLHHFTGSKEHNVALRGRAHARGVKINEYGIFDGETLIPCKDEVDIYRALGMRYVEPELREDRGEIAAALAGKLPRLVTDADLRGILHVHSTWSDGQVSIREMAEATLALGKEYLGICDHSQAAAYAGGLNRDAVRRQQEEIDRLNEEFAGRLRILKGTECDILKDGALDFDDATLATFDFVIALHPQQLPVVAGGADATTHAGDGESLLLDYRPSDGAYLAGPDGVRAGYGGGDCAGGRARRVHRDQRRSEPAGPGLAAAPLRHGARGEAFPSARMRTCRRACSTRATASASRARAGSRPLTYPTACR